MIWGWKILDCFSTDLCFHWLLLVHTLMEVELATFAFGNDALTNWATQTVKYCFWFHYLSLAFQNDLDGLCTCIDRLFELYKLVKRQKKNNNFPTCGIGELKFSLWINLGTLRAALSTNHDLENSSRLAWGWWCGSLPSVWDFGYKNTYHFWKIKAQDSGLHAVGTLNI